MASFRLPIVSEPRSGGDHSSCSIESVSTAPAQNGSGLFGVDSVGDFAGNVSLVTLGCAKNTVDSEVMLGALRGRGFRSVGDPADADLIIVNTCAFLESAVKEGIDTILGLSKHKQGGRCRQLVVAGCMVERYRGELTAALPEVDRFMSTDEILSAGDASRTSADCFSQARRPYFLYDESMPRVVSTGKHYAYVKIAEGCDRPCAFCIIPKIRGAFRSRPITSVVREVKSLLEAGTREVVFVAQDLTAYGNDLTSSELKGKQPQNLLRLLRELEPLGDNHDFWVRLLYAYPIGVDKELIETIRDSRVVANYLDMPLQHISNNVLKGMRRPLGERRTRELIEMIRTVAPEVALRTTFVVGFPGETDEDVESLRSFISEGHFAHVGVFTYSQESEAASFSYPNQVEDHVKEERRKLLMEEQQKVVEECSEAMLGARVRVLIDGVHPESELLLSARSEFQCPDSDGVVIVNDISLAATETGEEVAPESLVGTFAEVEITEMAGYDLIGRIV